MGTFQIYFLIVFFVNIVLGISVFATNHKRTINQLYLTLSITVALWLGSNWLILHAANEVIAEISVKFATAIAIFIPVSCHLLRLAILNQNDSWLGVMKRGGKLLFVSFSVSALCFSPYLISEIRMPSEFPDEVSIPEPVYNWAFFIFTALFVAIVGSLLITFIRDRKRVEGFKRIELEFITIGYSLALGIGSAFGLVVTALTGSSKTVPMANTTSILILTLIVAYGIATKRILGIATIIRKLAAYTLLTVYLIFVYLAVWKLSGLLFNADSIIPQIIGTLMVAFSMVPAHGNMQKLTAKLIVTKTMDVAGTMKKAGAIFQTVSTSDELKNHFIQLLNKALGPEFIQILPMNHGRFTSNGHVDSAAYFNFSKTDASMQIINQTREPICKDSLSRGRQSPLIIEAKDQLQQLDVSIIVGMFAKGELSGIVIFGQRAGGRIYDKTEQDALQILCNQFAVALENAELYTRMQDSKIQNEIMLDQLVSGVVVANPEGEITLFNHEAQRITGIDDKKAIGQHIQILPKKIYLALEGTLENKNGVRNIDAALFPQENSEESGKNIRMGSAFLFGHDGKPMGALLVFTDITELKGLEEQVRRTDQLSSVGTLAAGMAHEIKNPLVTIKTFTQLLPKRYNDEDFRNDFSSLVAHEVNRIDGIVNELLSFSKPAKPHLLPMNIQETIDQALKLIHEQLVQKNITLTNNCRAVSTHIFGDAKLLSQALINLNLNAIEAIGESGSITFGTLNCSHRFANGVSPDKATTRKCIRLQISDTGKGIERSDLQKIFDPFFTSKSEGTGMGLSVAHGIISEHHGVIEVESEPGRGTSFYIYIPLLEEGTVS